MNTPISPSASISSVKYFSTGAKSPLPAPPGTATVARGELPTVVSEESRVYTERGYDFDFKRRVFDHWDRLFANEGTGIAPPEKFFAVSRYAEIWSEVALRPVSLEPLNDVERQAVVSGVFHHLARRGAPHQSGNHHNNQGHAQRGGRGGGFASKRGFSSRNHSKSFVQQEEEEERPVLWAEESVTSLSGSIDDQGIFHSEKSAPNINSTGSSVVTPPGFTKEKEPEDTLWYYKDPKGNQQGPFTSQIMLDWYQRKFFTDSLPLRRQKDVMFEPLGYWRVKNGGKAPFEPAVEEQPPIVSFGNFSSTPAAVVQEEEQPVVIKKESPLVEPPAVIKQEQPMIAPIGRPSSPPALATNTAAKKVDVNVLFSSSTSIGRASSKSVSSESLEVSNGTAVTPSATSGWDNATTNSNAWSTSSSTNNSNAWSTSANANTNMSKPASKNNAVPAWNNVVNTATTPSFKSIIQEQKQRPTPVISAVASPQIVSWKKVGEPLAAAQPLSSIMQEQAVIDIKSEAAAPKKAVPLTFADLVNSMSSTTIAPPPPTTATPKIVQRPITTSSTSSTSTPVAANITKVGVIQKPAIGVNPLKEWCMNELTPLKSYLDLGTVVTLLLEIKSASEAAAFIRDNLNASKIDLVTFGREFVKRKFNKDMPAYAFIHQSVDEDEEQPFEQVQRRRK